MWLHVQASDQNGEYILPEELQIMFYFVCLYSVEKEISLISILVLEHFNIFIVWNIQNYYL